MEKRIKISSVHVLGVKELQNRENEKGGIFKEIMAKKYPVLKTFHSIFIYSVNCYDLTNMWNPVNELN